jgi:SpoVK/Ycf46/Vps4 family AAA+-type ATPase
MVFMEDIDVLSAQLSDPTYTSRLLDTFDGFETKGKPFVLVMTTNHAEEITQGMTRPGRIHAIISIGAMDRPGVERLANVVIGGDLEPDIDWDAVYASTEGYMPAFVREGIERSLRYSIQRTGEVSLISTADLVYAMGSLRGQFNLHMAATDRPDKMPGLDRMFRQAIKEEAQIDGSALSQVVDEQIENRLNGASIRDTDGEYRYTIETN